MAQAAKVAARKRSADGAPVHDRRDGRTRAVESGQISGGGGMRQCWALDEPPPQAALVLCIALAALAACAACTEARCCRPRCPPRRALAASGVASAAGPASRRLDPRAPRRSRPRSLRRRATTVPPFAVVARSPDGFDLYPPGRGAALPGGLRVEAWPSSTTAAAPVAVRDEGPGARRERARPRRLPRSWLVDRGGRGHAAVGPAIAGPRTSSSTMHERLLDVAAWDDDRAVAAKIGMPGGVTTCGSSPRGRGSHGVVLPAPSAASTRATAEAQPTSATRRPRRTRVTSAAAAAEGSGALQGARMKPRRRRARRAARRRALRGRPYLCEPGSGA